MCREIPVSGLKMWLLQLRIKNLHYLFIEEYFFVRIFILLLKVWTCHMELDLPVLLGAGMFVG